MELSDREIDILAFERSWWATGRPKDAAIRERFELSSAEYYRLLGDLLDRPEALGHDPLLIRRLRRQRLTRQRERSARRARD
jgi:hypothetical protein